MKVEKVEEFLRWLSNKIQQELIIPSVVDWSYVASNKNQTKYCWGNETMKQLKENGLIPENINYNDEGNTTLKKVKQYKSSKLGIYDMCGNTHELVKDGEVFMVKGNSYKSDIEKSDEAPMDFGYDLGPMLGLRVFYIISKNK